MDELMKAFEALSDSDECEEGGSVVGEVEQSVPKPSAQEESHIPVPDLPKNAKAIDAALKLPFDATGHSFQGPISFSLYKILLKFLVLQYNMEYSCSIAEYAFTKSQKAALLNFIKENIRNLFYNKNNSKPIYQLQTDILGNFVVNEYDGLPVIIHNTYNKKTKLFSEYKIVVYKEILTDVFTSLHCTKAASGLQSCLPGGVNSLSKSFNAKFYYKGVFQEIRKYLQACGTCRINVPLKMTQAPPPKPIRAFHPHERLQYDLIDMAPSKKRGFMKNNQWHFRYILSIKCCFSKFCWLFPLKRKKASHVYNVVKFLFDIEGPPKILQSDNGKEFVNKLIKQLSADYGFRMIQGKPYTPQHQGQVERLNQTVKMYLRRLLQNSSPAEQAKTWPVLLPGIADKINKSYHSTIDDIPFRVYRNRETSSLNFTIVPDDTVFFVENEELSTPDSEDEDEDTCDSDDDGDDDDDDDDGDDKRSDCKGTSMCSVEDLLQSCVGSSLSKSCFSNTLSSQLVSDSLESHSNNSGTDTEVDAEEDFEQIKFTSCLFQHSLTKSNLQLHVLESTECTIHRNIERNIKNCPGDKFNVGDSVLIKNPAVKMSSIKTQDPFAPANVVAQVTEILPEGMYKLELSEGQEVFKKDVFEGEMVLFKAGKNNLDISNNVSPKFSNKKHILDAICDFGLQVRRTMYRAGVTRGKHVPGNINKLFQRYFEGLDCGVLSHLYQDIDSDLQRQFHDEYTKCIDELKSTGFSSFLYGSVAWERRRKVWLSDSLLKFLNADNQHKCIECFSDINCYCSHACCQQMALNFAERCGVKAQIAKKQASSGGKKRKRVAKSMETTSAPPKKMQTSINSQNESSFQIIDSSIHDDMTDLNELFASCITKCDCMQQNAIISPDIKNMLQTFRSRLITSSKEAHNWSPNTVKNLQHFLQVVFQECSPKNKPFWKQFNHAGLQLCIQMQGCTSLCGMCALNNTIHTSFEQCTMNQIADSCWLQEVNFKSIHDDLENHRAPSGDYNIDVLSISAQSVGYVHKQLNNEVESFFASADPDCLENDADNMYQDFLTKLGVKTGDRILLNNAASHYVACLFLQTKCIILDSIDGALEYTPADCLVYFWQLVYSKGFGIYKYVCQRIAVVDNPDENITSDKDFTAFDIMSSSSSVDDCQEVSNTFPHATAHDMRTLQGDSHVNDSIMHAVGLAMNMQHQDAFVVDPLIGTQLIKNQFYKISRKKSRQFPPLGKKKIIFPLNTQQHWWALCIDLDKSNYFICDSLGQEHEFEVKALLQALSNNNFRKTGKLVEKSTLLPLQNDNAQCALFVICYMVSFLLETSPDFSIFDMDDVRDLLAQHIVNGNSKELASADLWRESISDDGILKYILTQGPEQEEIDEMNMTMMYGKDAILLKLNSLVRRYLYELRDSHAKNIPTGHHFAALTNDQLDDFLNWKENMILGDKSYVFLTPLVRRYFKQQQETPNNVTYLGENWALISKHEERRLDDWEDETINKMTLSRESEH